MEKRDEIFKGAKIVEDQIGYQFKNQLLLKQAFIRKSFSEENGGENNEVLEFIGDKVLDVAVIRYLSKKYGSDLNYNSNSNNGFYNILQPTTLAREFECALNEGELTKLKQKMVQKKALAGRIDELEFERFLFMGEGDKKGKINQSDSVKEDLFEAIIGAVALDSNWDFDKLQEVVEVMLDPDSFIDDEDDDYVSLIYEWTERKYRYEPRFKYFECKPERMWFNPQPDVICEEVGTYGYNHFKKACQVKLALDIPAFEGYGESNNQARRAACRLAYKKLEEKAKLFTIRDEISTPNENEAINQLETLARRGYFELPIYEYEESHDGNGNPIWTVTCRIEGYNYYFGHASSSKKHAKKIAALKMLNYVMDHYKGN
nr:ribonuclease III domain-containing protein [uncultured Butyrivibrio sp.]